MKNLKIIIYVVFIFFLNFVKAENFNYLEQVKLEKIENKGSLLVIKTRENIFAFVMEKEISCSAISLERVVFIDENNVVFSVNLPRPSSVTFVSPNLVESLTKEKSKMADDFLRDNQEIKSKILFQKLIYLKTSK